MYIDVVFCPDELASRGDISTKSVVIIDVLRATTTIAYALWGYRTDETDGIKGCKKVIPVESIERAYEEFNRLCKEKTLIAGERFCLKPEGFDLGNSPSEYTIDKVKDKVIVFSTTNGTKALKLAEKAKFITTASFINASACTQRVIQEKNDVIILCAGRSGKTTMEDSCCAVLIAELLFKRCQENNRKFELSDSADIAIKYLNHYKGKLIELLESSEAGKNLIEVGLETDLKDCATIDALPIYTEYSYGSIKAGIIS